MLARFVAPVLALALMGCGGGGRNDDEEDERVGESTTNPTPAPAATWARIDDRLWDDAVGPDMCAQPSRIVIYKDGHFHAYRCVWDAENERVSKTEKINGQLTASELAELTDIANSVAKVIARSRYSCNADYHPFAEHYLDLQTSRRREYRAWKLDIDRGLCSRGPIASIDRLHGYVHGLVDRYFPTP